VPLDAPPFSSLTGNPTTRRAWLRPVKKKAPSIAGSGTSPSDSGSPSNFFNNPDGSQIRSDHENGSVNGSNMKGTPQNVSMIPPTQSTGITPPIATSLTLDSTSPSIYNTAAYEAYEALMNPPGSVASAPSSGMQSNDLNGSGLYPSAAQMSVGNTYGQMDAADLLAPPATDDILALLNNSSFEPAAFDLGMMYPAPTANGVNGVGSSQMNGMYGSPSNGVAPGAVNGEQTAIPAASGYEKNGMTF
jgi:hypothetical protein